MPFSIASSPLLRFFNVQSRTVTTDAAGRTTDVTEPERGETTYGYAYNSTGLVVTRKRPPANQTSTTMPTAATTTQYDLLGRVVGVTYNDNLTPNKTFAYDTNASWVWTNFSPTNLKGRLYLASVPTAATVHSYDPMGRVINQAECLPSGCGNAAYDKPLVYTYDWAGNLTSERDLQAGNITYGRSPAGEITSVTNNTFTLSGAAGTATLLSNPVNGPSGQISYTFGNGLSQSNSYDSLGRLNGGWVCVGAPSGGCANPNVPQRFGFVVSWSGSRVSSSGENYVGNGITYQYDDFNRLSGMQNPSTNTTYSYLYDRYGNRWQQNALQGGTGFNPSYNTANNRLISSNSVNYIYDAAGNMTYDAATGHHFTYDAEGNILQSDAGQSNSWSYVFDALNHRVRSQYSGGVSEATYDVAGHIISGWSGPTTASESHIYADNQQIAYRSGDGQTYFVHQNWLGTDRVHTDMNGVTGAAYASLPFGDGGSANASEAYASWDFQHFGTLDVNYWDSTYHAQYRNYSETEGRWTSPDPYDGSYDTANPQSFNRYAYVLNNPLSYIDPSGLDTSGEVYQCGVDPVTGNPIYCLKVITGPGNPDPYPSCTPLLGPQGQYYGCIANTPSHSGTNGEASKNPAPYSAPYMNVPGIGMVGGPPRPQGCDYVAKVGNAAVHATATGFGNLKGTAAKLMAGVKFAAPTIGVYTETGATLLGVGEAAAAGLGATASGAAEAVGGLSAAYAVGSGIVDFYKQLTDPSIGCSVANP